MTSTAPILPTLTDSPSISFPFWMLHARSRRSGHAAWKTRSLAEKLGAIGIEQLQGFEPKAQSRQRLARQYDGLLRDHPRIRLLSRDYETVVPHIYVVRIQGLTDRKALQARLLERGIQTGIHYQPNHELSFYRDPGALPLPVTDAVFPEILTLPMHPDVTCADVEHVCRQLKVSLDG